MGDPYTWKELRDGRGIVISSTGQGETRAWYIAGVSPDAAMADTNPIKPVRGDADPHTGLYCNKVGYAHWANGTRCEAEYVPQEYLDTAQESDAADDWFDADGNTYDLMRKPPVIEKVRQSLAAAGGSDIDIWRFLSSSEVAAYKNTGIQFSMEVVAEVESTPQLDTMLSLLNVIADEQGKIHLINGREYEFTCIGSGRITKDKYRFVYNWRSDPGIRNDVAWDNQGTGNWRPLGGYMVAVANDDYIIPPFSRLDTAPALDGEGRPDPTALPVVRVAPTHVRNPLGWLNMPGVIRT